MRRISLFLLLMCFCFLTNAQQKVSTMANAESVFKIIESKTPLSGNVNKADMLSAVSYQQFSPNAKDSSPISNELSIYLQKAADFIPDMDVEDINVTYDNCSDVTPTVLANGVPVTFTGNTSEGTTSTVELGVLGAGAVWEAVTLTGDCNNLTIDYCGTAAGIMDTMFIIYTTDCPATAYVMGTYDFTTCGDGNGTLYFTSLPAGTYYIPVLADSGYNVVLGEYTMNVVVENCAGTPSNDDCANAIAVSCGDSISGSTQAATNSGGNAAGDVFYTYTGSGTPENVTISLCGSSYDTYLRIYSDCTLSTQLFGNDDFCGLQSEITFLSDGTSTYVIMVEGYSSNTGNYTMNVSCVEPYIPEEPDYPCFQGDGLASNGFQEGYMISSAMYRQADDFVVDPGVEFSFEYLRFNLFSTTVIQNVSFNILADAGGTPSETIVASQASVTPTSQQILGSNYGLNIYEVEVVLPAEIILTEGTYWLQPVATNVNSTNVYWEVSTLGTLGAEMHESTSGGAWGAHPGYQGVFFVAGECSATYDDCSDVTPTVLTSGVPVTFTGDTSEGTASTEEMNVLGYGAVWEAVTLTGACNNLTIDYCGTPAGNMDTMFIVYTPDCPATSYVVGSYDFSTCGDGNGTLRFTALPAGTYYLPVILGGGNTLGEYTMNVLSEDCPPPPANDDCADAIAVSCGDSISGSTQAANNSGGNAAGDVFYTYTGTGTAEYVTVSLCGSSYDTYLRIYSDCTLSTQLYTNDDFCGLQSEITFVSDGTSTYVIMVEGFSSNTGNYTMNISCEDLPEPPQDCDDHEVLDNGMEDAYFLTASLAVDIPVADTGFTVAGLNVTTAGAGSVFDVTFYNDAGGVPGAVLQTVSTTIDSSVVIGQNYGYDFINYTLTFNSTVDLSANTTYWMRVVSNAVAWDWTSSPSSVIGYYSVYDNGGGWTSTGGEFVYDLICEEIAETNDNCSDVTPEVLTNGVPVTFTGDTSEGTASAEEMNVLGYGAVWEAVTLTGDCNNLTIDYCGTPAGNMNNMFIVYTPDCPATSYVIGSYDFNTCGDGNGTLRFTGLPAGTYYLPVIVDGVSNVLGAYTMNVLSEDCPPPPANDDCADAIAVACGDSVTGSTQAAMDSGGNPAGDVFYTYTGSGTEEYVTISLCGSSYDTYLRIYSDCTLSTQLYGNDDFCGLQSEITFVSDGTSTYVIMVEGFSSNTGDYIMNVTCDDLPDPPAECEDHEVLDNGMENAYFFANRLAVDIPVGDAGFIVEGLYITIAVPIGTNASSFNFIFYDSNSGLPGTEVDTAIGTIIGSDIIGQNFGRDFIQYNVDFDAGVALNANTTYWMEVQSDAEAWDWTSDMTAFIGAGGVINSGGGWAPADGGEFVYALYCDEMGAGDMNSFNFAYYPNPVKDFLNIQSQKAVESIEAFNLAGQKVINNAHLTEGKLNLSSLSAGTYVFRVTLEGGQVETFKIVKK